MTKSSKTSKAPSAPTAIGKIHSNHAASSKKQKTKNSSKATAVKDGVTAGGILPQKLYEVLRWAVWIVLPAIATLVSGLNAAWNWNWPIDAILTTFSVIETFLGTVLGIAKLSHDAPEIPSKKELK